MGIHSRRRIAFALAATSTLSWSALASAQATGPVAPEEPGNPPLGSRPAAAGDKRESEGGLQDIVVTATRREERLQDVPVTVTAITAESLATADVASVRELTQVVPGFVGSRNAGVFQPVIRGVGSTGISVGDEPNVATYIDGVYQPETGANWIDLVEVERVEVLKGPQGTVFGRNATGGLINVITPDPKFEWGGRAAGKVGFLRNDAMHIDLRTYATGPLSENVAFDIAGLYKRNGGYIKDLVHPDNGAGDMEIRDARAKLLFRPSDRAQIVITGEVFDQESEVNAPQPYFNPATGFDTAGRLFPGVIIADDPWEVAGNLIPFVNLRRYNMAMHTRFEFDPFNLETTTGWLRYHWRQETDSDASNIFLGTFPAQLFSESVSQEVRLLSTNPGRLQWLLGGYFYDLSGGADFQPIQLFPAFSAPHLTPRAHVRSWAGFAEGTLEVVDTLFITGGARYTWEKRDFIQIINGNRLRVPALGYDPDGTTSKSFKKWTYRGAVRWQFAPDANFYVSYGTGFKSGVFNMAANSGVPVNPETIKTWEGGLKADPLSWLRTNLAIYHNDYKDLQVQARQGVSYILQNASNAEIYGGELELTASPTPDLNIRGAVAYVHARYKDFPRAQGFIPLPTGGNNVVTVDASDKVMTRAPEWTFNIGGDWTTDIGGGRGGVAGNLFHSSKLFYDFLNNFRQDAYTLVNGQVFWMTPDERWRFSIYATNITNEAVWQTLRPGALSTDGFYEKPREVGVGVEIRF
jgi:iron complex outermembrane receptor protein